MIDLIMRLAIRFTHWLLPNLRAAAEEREIVEARLARILPPHPRGWETAGGLEDNAS